MYLRKQPFGVDRPPSSRGLTVKANWLVAGLTFTSTLSLTPVSRLGEGQGAVRFLSEECLCKLKRTSFSVRIAAVSTAAAAGRDKLGVTFGNWPVAGAI